MRTASCPKGRVSPLAQEPGQAGREAVALISGVKLLMSRLAPSNPIWAPSVGLAPQGSAPRVCEGRRRDGGGGAPSWFLARVTAPV